MSNVIEKLPAGENIAEVIADELYDKNKPYHSKELTKQFQRTAEKKVFDKLSIKLSTSGIEDKTIENYYNQIKNNRYVAKKGMYLVVQLPNLHQHISQYRHQ